MGWYTQGPGGVTYKYGDVIEALWYTDMGTLFYHPRLAATGDDDIDALTFLEDVQKKAAQHDLPWTTLPFDAHDICSGLLYQHNEDEIPTQLSDHIRHNQNTLKTLLAREDDLHDVQQLYLSVEWTWIVQDHEIDALYQWLIDECHASLTRDALAQGTVDVWYRPPASVDEAFEDLTRNEHFVASMLGAHAIHGGPFEAHQPDDDYQWLVDL